MKRAEFDWDKYLATAKYAEVVRNSPDLFSRRPPTLYSPDQAWLYLSSQDLAVETDDTDGLKSILDNLLGSYKSAKATNDHRKLSIIRIDCIEVCELLLALGESPEDYDNPDRLLDS